MYRFVNKSGNIYRNSPKNMSSFLKREVINPWSISGDTVQVIKEERLVYNYDGLEQYNSANYLGILVFSIVFGAILSILGEKGKQITQWFNCLFLVTMKMVQIVIWLVLFFICACARICNPFSS